MSHEWLKRLRVTHSSRSKAMNNGVITTSSLVPVVAPVAGQHIRLTTVADTVFSCGLRSATDLLLPATDRLVAPAVGQVTAIAADQRCIGVRTVNGLETVIQFSVTLPAKFKTAIKLAVKVGDWVTTGQVIAVIKLKLARLNRQKTIVPSHVLHAFMRLQRLFFTATHRIAPEGNVDTKSTRDMAGNHWLAAIGPPVIPTTELTRVLG